LLHVGICYKSLASHMFLIQFREIEITRNEFRVVVRVCHNLPAVVLQPVKSGLQCGDQQFISLCTP